MTWETVDLLTKQTREAGINDLVDVTKDGSRFVYTVPHAGRLVPTSLTDAWNLGEDALKDTDLFTEELYDFDEAVRVETTLNRYVVNMNRKRRHDGVVDAYDKEDALRTFLKGMRPSWDASWQEHEEFLHVYDEYHDSIRAALKHLRRSQEDVFLLTCHSMNAQADSNTPDRGARPDFTVCTEHGSSASDRVVKSFHDALNVDGMSVKIDDPYAGGHTTQRHAVGCEAIHGLQVEVNKARYMDETAMEYNDDEAQQVRALLRDAVTNALKAIKE